MESFKECISTKYTVESFCNNQNISRSTIYKKNLNGHLNYKPAIDFINEYNDTFDFVTSRRMKKYLRELSFDVNLLESLLKKEAQIYGSKPFDCAERFANKKLRTTD